MNYFNILDGNAQRILADQRQNQINQQASMLLQHQQQREQDLDLANPSLLQQVINNNFHSVDSQRTHQGTSLGGFLGSSQAEFEQREKLAILQEELKLQEQMQMEAILINKIQEEAARAELEREQELRQIKRERLLSQFHELDHLAARQEMLLQHQQHHPNLNALFGNRINAPLESLGGSFGYDSLDQGPNRGNGNFTSHTINRGLQRFSSFDHVDRSGNDLGLPISRHGKFDHPLQDAIKSSVIMSHNDFLNDHQEQRDALPISLLQRQSQNHLVNPGALQRSTRSNEQKATHAYHNNIPHSTKITGKQKEETPMNDVRFFNNGVEVRMNGEVKKRDSRPLKKRKDSITKSLSFKRPISLVSEVVKKDLNVTAKKQENMASNKKVKYMRTGGPRPPKTPKENESKSYSTPAGPHAVLIGDIFDKKKKKLEEKKSMPDGKTEEHIEKSSKSDADEDIERKMNAADALLAIMKPV
jgi:hypothetical protein